MVGGIAGVVVGHAGLDAVAREAELAGSDEAVMIVELRRVPELPPVASGRRRGVFEDGRVEVVDAGLEGRIYQRGIGSHGQEVADDVHGVAGGQRGDGVHIKGVDLRGWEALLAELARDALGPLQVVIGEHHLLEDLALRVAALSQDRHRLAHASGANDQYSHK